MAQRCGFSRKFAAHVVIALFTLTPVANANESCPVTVLEAKFSGQDESSRLGWFGSGSFAVRLPRDGIWLGMGRERNFFDKLFWYVEGFRPGMEDEFTVTGRRLDDNQSSSSPLFSGATNAKLDNIGWSVLTGLGFPAAGCWQVTGSFKGRDLTFVVRVVDAD